MDEFLKEYYNFITSLVEFTAAFTGIILYKKYKSTPVKFIIYFLIYAFLVDLLGGYPSFLKSLGYFHLIEGTLIEKNYWWYTIFWWIGLSTIIFYLNYQIIKTELFKKIIKYAYFIYLSQVLIYIILKFESLFSYERFISISSLWYVILTISIYFYEILRSNSIILFYKSVYFYFNTAFFVWILIMIPIDFFEVYFGTDDWSYVLLKWKIYLTLNIFLYLTLSSSLIFCKAERN